MGTWPESRARNRTLQILRSATEGEYGVLAIICYNIEHLTALVRAAEAKRSPLILQLFPSTVKQLPTLAWAAAAAVKSATVPLSLHLDHAQDEGQIRDIAANLPFDSIMVDMSHYDHDENLAKTKILTRFCHENGIAVEAESGRINGGEEGIADTGSLEALFTTPEEVEDFLAAEVDLLAPSIGNIHGDYGPAGPQLDYQRLADVNRQIAGRVGMALHGTNDFTPEVMRRCIQNGTAKLNINKLILECWNVHLGEHAREPLMQLLDGGMAVLQAEVERWMDVCGSSGKALTCRKRRVKCDEAKPSCNRCSKADRECRYGQLAVAEPSDAGSDPANLSDREDVSQRKGYGSRSVASPCAIQGPRESSTEHPTEHEAFDNARTAFSASPGPLVPPDSSDSFRIGVPGAPSHNGRIDADDDEGLPNLDFSVSPLAASQIPLLNISPFEWYDLLAQDAISHIQRVNDATNGDPRWRFDESTLSRAQSGAPARYSSSHPGQTNADAAQELPSLDYHDDEPRPLAAHDSISKPWNTTSSIELSATDMRFLRYYTEVVGPILDLFDPVQHFTKVVPHLAMRNTGLLKALLAVAARYMSLDATAGAADDTVPVSASPDSTLLQGNSLPDSGLGQVPAQIATQYYYETLQYLSQTLLYPSYADSDEILATAILISTYEMFDTDPATRSGNWERHLRGAFWIQRSQDNDGESIDGLRRAVWWAWLRQDIWAAFRAGRPTLTIWRPRRRLEDLDSDELATRILYICAKCVEFASSSSADSGAGQDRDIRIKIDHGNKLLRSLQDWYDILPLSYKPIVVAAGVEDELSAAPTVSSCERDDRYNTATTDDRGRSAVFPSVWIHPPNHAGAMQMYHFAKAIVLLNQPTTGGLSEYRQRQKRLSESVNMVCGIANAYRDKESAVAFVSVQAVFAVGLFVQVPAKQDGLLYTLEQMLKKSKFPAPGLVAELKQVWAE
ncbi:related to fructose-bisphosphate aldolase [Cephalotrichum gorgonifer]|uniref:Related to fructose-bisphosphate aldolase n=1 Tax=Cephalotrichum gorgonifer TaxID=2041049 RepID=A0AAE8N2B8_9PEZI|nr:related to fructose-bisphosphate aldolase [Cephalotrichum gorgonifer]